MSLTFDEICIDAHDAAALGAWWSNVLGWRHYLDRLAVAATGGDPGIDKFGSA